MYNFKKKYSSKTLLTIIIVMTLSFVMLFTTACGNNSGSSSDSESDSSKAFPTDYQTITNGDFEFNTQNYKYTNFPVNSSIGWTRSNDSITNSATTSTKTSGIIDTTDYEFERDEDGNVVYDNNGQPKYALKDGEKIPVFSVIAPKHLPVISGTDGEDDAVYYNPYTPYYYGLIDSTDNNPEDGDPTRGTKVLMIANKTATAGKGTAQRFTSTKTLTLYPGQYAQVSVWVKTYELTTLMDTKDFGAYISLSSMSVGSVSKENFVVKYINTYGQWMKYTINVAGSDYATTSYKVVLGLGNGSKDITSEYVEGYAFFDNVTYKTLTKEEYEATESTTNKTVNFYTKNGSEETFSEDTSEMKILANQVFASKEDVKKNDAETGDKYSEYTANLNFLRNGYAQLAVEGSAKKNDVYDRQHDSSFGNADVGLKAWNAIGDVTNGIEYPFDPATPTVYFNFANPASYTFTSDKFTLAAGQYQRITFWTKVNLNNKAAKAFTINVVDTTADGKYTTTTTVKESLETSDMTNESYGDWIKYTVVVSNTFAKEGSSYAKDRYFYLEFNFGPTTNTTDILDFPTGYAFVSNFEYSYLSADDYKQVYTSDSNYKAVALSADMQSSSFVETKESYKFTYPFFEDITNVASEDVTGYLGFVGNSLKVGGTEENKFTQEETKAGVINTKYLDNYVASGLFTAAEKASLEAWLENVDLGDNQYLQPLIIKNSAPAAYGFQQSSSSTFAANSIYEVTVKLMILGENTNAYVYLTDGDNSSDFKVLKISGGKNEYTKEEAFEQQLSTKLTSADWANAAVTESGKAGKSWLEVKFYVTTGNEAIDYKIEVWNGSRDASVKSEGLVAIGDIDVATLTESELALAKRRLAQSYNQNDEYKFNFEDGIHFTRLPSTVKTDKNPNGEVRNYEKTDTKNAGIAFYTNKVATFANYSNINVESELDERTTEDSSSSSGSSSSSSSASTETSYSVGLYAATLSVSIALILILLIILVRKIYKAVKGKNKSTKSYYSRDTRAKAMEKIANDKLSKIQLTDENDEKTDYDYDNMENNVASDDEPTEETIEKIEITEDPSEETTEEVIEEIAEVAEENAENGEQPETTEEQPSTEEQTTADEQPTEQSEESKKQDNE